MGNNVDNTHMYKVIVHKMDGSDTQEVVTGGNLKQ